METCPHDPPRAHRVCAHLLAHDTPHRIRFTGAGTEYELVCATCAAADTEACDECWARAREGGPHYNAPIVGEPSVVEAPGAMRFELERFAGPRFHALAPLRGADHARWLGAADDGLHVWDLDARTSRRIAPLPPHVDIAQRIVLHASRDLAVIGTARANEASIIDLDTGASVRELVRDDYQTEHYDHALAFVTRGDRTLLVHAPAWNRLDVIDPRTGEVLTARGPTSYGQGQERPPHYLDYFHATLAVSPNQHAIADAGWVWGPCGITHAWSLTRWLDDNVWESEDGPSLKRLTWTGYHWDGPMCWLDDTHLAVWGWGDDDPQIDAARVLDTTTGRERWFAGPRRGPLAFDGRALVSLVDLSAWDVDAGSRIARAPVDLTAFHPDARVAVGYDDGMVVVARLCGHHAAAAWNTERVRAAADAITHADELPILGDALELAGCTDDALLAHCRAPGPHAGNRCWALDRLR